MVAQKLTREAFNDAGDMPLSEQQLLALSVSDISKLSAAQIIHAVHYLKKARASVEFTQPQRQLGKNLEAGSLYNENLRDWYNEQTETLKNKAAKFSSAIWEQPITDLSGRKRMALLELRGEFRDFFNIQRMLFEEKNKLYAENGFPQMGDYLSDRYENGLFPRDVNVYPLSAAYYQGSEDPEPAKVLKSFQEFGESCILGLAPFAQQFFISSGLQLRVGEKFVDINPDYEFGDPNALGRYSDEAVEMSLQPYLIMGMDISFEKLIMPNSIAHEISHGLIGCLRGKEDEVEAAYTKDLAAIQKKAKQDSAFIENQKIEYFLPKNAGGVHEDRIEALNEALVQGLAELIQNGKDYSRNVLKNFPATAAMARIAMEIFKREYDIAPTGMEFPWGPAIKDALQAKNDLHTGAKYDSTVN